MNTVNNTNRNNNNSNNGSKLEQALATIINECQNIVKFSELEKLAAGTDCEGDYICITEDLSAQLEAAQAEVNRLTAVIEECESAKAKTEEATRKEKEEAEKFLASLTSSGKEVLSYLEGLKTLATGDNLILVDNVLRVFAKYSGSYELTLLANFSAYVAILVKEEKYDVIKLLETITLKIDEISCNGASDIRVKGLDRVLVAVQDIY